MLTLEDRTKIQYHEKRNKFALEDQIKIQCYKKGVTFASEDQFKVRCHKQVNRENYNASAEKNNNDAINIFRIEYKDWIEVWYFEQNRIRRSKIIQKFTSEDQFKVGYYKQVGKHNYKVPV